MTTHDYTRFAHPLAHPGEHLREDFLPSYSLTAGALAKAMGLKDRTRVERLIREKATGNVRHRVAVWKGVWDLAGILDEPTEPTRPFGRRHRRSR